MEECIARIVIFTGLSNLVADEIKNFEFFVSRNGP